MVDIDPSWYDYLKDEFEKDYFKKLINFVELEYANHTCYPNIDAIYRAFEYSSYEKTKVVIIGQDPYHGPNQANGMCFSVNEDISPPPSLVNIFKELKNDLGMEDPSSGDLSYWANQGVLLLNATLTVRAHSAGSHQNKGWEQFTNKVITSLNEHSEPIVFLLWGGFAKKKKPLIDTKKHYVLESGHPSPLSANRGYWFGNKHFSQANSLLEQAGLQPIDWRLS